MENLDKATLKNLIKEAMTEISYEKRIPTSHYKIQRINWQKVIKGLANSKDMSIMDVANELCITYKTLYNKLKLQSLSLTQIAQIAEFLEIELHDLINLLTVPEN